MAWDVDERRRFWWSWGPCWAAAGLATFFYVALAWTPSSYVLVFRGLGIEGDPGLIAGTPRQIRSDEFNLLTPLIQAAVDNDFGQVNRTSAYGESLRTQMPLPLADWALAFKPCFWGFFVLDPGRAYSWYYASTALAFWFGWALLFVALGLETRVAWGAAAILFFCAFTQTWWTTFGQMVAFLPWIFVALLWPTRSTLARWIAMVYATTVWQLSGLFHPPMLLNFAVATLILLVAFKKEGLGKGRWLEGLTAAIAAGLLAFLYLHEPLLQMAKAENMGQRYLPSGAIGWVDLLGLVLPAFSSWDHRALVAGNICESSSSGSYLLLLLLAFVDWRRWWSTRELTLGALGPSLLLALPAMAMLAWMALRGLPRWLGQPLMWDVVFGGRLLFPTGLLLLGLLLWWLPRLPLRFSWVAALGVALLVVATWYPTVEWIPRESIYHPGVRGQASPGLDGPAAWLRQTDLILLPLLVGLGIWLKLRRRALEASDLVWVAAAANAWIFFGFNPLQDARPIFARPSSPKLEILRERQAAHPEGILVVGGSEFHGAILNGYGFRSINHALLVPETAFFARYFPRLDAKTFAYTFNRLAFVAPSHLAPPWWDSRLREPREVGLNAILLPPDAFLPKPEVQLLYRPPGLFLAPFEDALGLEILRGGKRIFLDFAGPIDGIRGSTKVLLYVDRPVRVVDIWVRPRWMLMDPLRDPRLFSRYVVELEAHRPLAPRESLGLCIWVDDPELGSGQIAIPPVLARSACPGGG